MKYFFATNINGTNKTGIVDDEMHLLCLCPKENAAMIINALEKSPMEAAAPEMYNWLQSIFIRSQMNGLLELDSDERRKLNTLLAKARCENIEQ